MKKLSGLLIALMLIGILVLSAACSSMSKSTTTATQNYPQTTHSTYSQPPAAYTTSAPMTTNTHTYAPTQPAITQSTTGIKIPTPNVTVTVPATTSAYPASTTTNAGGGGGGGGGYTPSPTGTIGLSAGGAKDISNFRENIRNNFLPLPTDVTYEGLFYDYFFDTGASEPANKLFSPSYSTAVTRDPFSNQTEYYMAVGLNSGLKESDFQRKKLNLVIVLDNSGSMNEFYNQYYYDNNGQPVDAYADEGVMRQNKMNSADQSVVNILNQLNSDDWFSIVTFNSQASVVKQMGPLSQADMGHIEDQVMNIMSGGSTNLDAGLDEASRQFGRLKNVDPNIYENRVIVLTDAQPNTGDISSSGFLKTLENNANQRLFTTFIGIGVDFNSSLIEQISKIKGCNYYSVHSPNQFRQRIREEFDFMVTPLVFNVDLRFESSGWRIEKVFGSPQADEASGRLMRIDTLFPAKSDSSGQVKGGLVLLKLQKTSSGNASIYLRTTYEDRNGHADGDVQVINLASINPEHFDNSGIRKGVLLTRYAALLKNWMAEERQYGSRTNWTPCVSDDSGIVLPLDYSGQWERQSVNLTVSAGYNRLFNKFTGYFTSEMQAIGDYDLGQELDVLNQLDRH